MKSITLLKIALFSLLLATLVPAHAQNYTKITYVHSDADGTPFAATDSRGNVEWHIDHYPYGKEYSNTQVARKNDISFAGKPYDEEIGLSYFGGRWYDPDIGRFTGIDPMPVNPNDYRTFNRYSYGFNNPYKYVDPDGNLPVLIPIAIFIAKEVAAEAASRATGGATDFLSFRRMGTKAIKKGTGVFVKKNSDKLTSNKPELGGGSTLNKLTPGEIKRIQNAADRSGKEISVVGSRVNPKKELHSKSDYDFVIDVNSKTRNNLSRSLPGAKNISEGIRGNQDIFKGTVDKSKPYVTFKPKPK